MNRKILLVTDPVKIGVETVTKAYKNPSTLYRNNLDFNRDRLYSELKQSELKKSDRFYYNGYLVQVIEVIGWKK